MEIASLGDLQRHINQTPGTPHLVVQSALPRCAFLVEKFVDSLVEGYGWTADNALRDRLKQLAHLDDILLVLEGVTIPRRVVDSLAGMMESGYLSLSDFAEMLLALARQNGGSVRAPVEEISSYIFQIKERMEHEYRWRMRTLGAAGYPIEAMDQITALINRVRSQVAILNMHPDPEACPVPQRLRLGSFHPNRNPELFNIKSFGGFEDLIHTQPGALRIVFESLEPKHAVLTYKYLVALEDNHRWLVQQGTYRFNRLAHLDKILLVICHVAIPRLMLNIGCDIAVRFIRERTNEVLYCSHYVGGAMVQRMTALHSLLMDVVDRAVGVHNVGGDDAEVLEALEDLRAWIVATRVEPVRLDVPPEPRS